MPLLRFVFVIGSYDVLPSVAIRTGRGHARTCRRTDAGTSLNLYRAHGHVVTIL